MKIFIVIVLILASVSIGYFCISHYGSKPVVMSVLAVSMLLTAVRIGRTKTVPTPKSHAKELLSDHEVSENSFKQK